MSIEIIEKEPPILKERNNVDEYFKNLDVVIPFSDFFHKIELLDIYSGDENIPFSERAPEYRKLLEAEFL